MFLKSLKSIAAAALLAVALSTGARAADLPPGPDTGDWKFVAALYGWGAGLNGDVGVFGLPAQNVDLPFSDVIQNLDFAAMGMAEARKGRFMMGMDATYTNVSMSVNTPKGILANKIDVTNTSLMLSGVAGYGIVDTGMARLDLIAGARLWSVNNDFDARGGQLGGRSKSDGATWVDPLVGAKLRVDLLPRVYMTSWAMIGGFGVGSDLMWDLMGGAGYDFTDNFSLFAGYRAVSVDYSNDGFVYDVVEQGPLAALVVKF
ncbi:MAG: hypothetical protein IOC82_08775 [Aestuariivirga sp.]|uniref:hypothetical protein n=1 Tax=Aestuariivirga sp. TaxID=2650926 RepID=UPI0025B9A32B|nr:hypothetical protein [Aestuariivirga sp.]MCA3561104.1 hypothetical protein [Aestuariivirga sp.]